MGPCCHAGLVFQSSWLLHESVASFSAADQLFILPPAWRAVPPPFPLPGLTPFPSGSRHLPVSSSATVVTPISLRLNMAGHRHRGNQCWHRHSGIHHFSPVPDQKNAGLIPNRTGSCIVYYFNSGIVPDAGQSGIPAWIHTHTYTFTCIYIWTYNMDRGMSMQHERWHAEWTLTWICSMDMNTDMQQGQWGMGMQHSQWDMDI